MTQQDVDRLLREAHRHWFEDGLPEMALGLLFLAIGGYLALRVALVTSGLLAGVVSVTLPLLIVTYALGMRSLVFALKKRYTLPHRAHSLRPPGEWQRRWALTISGGALAILIVFLFLGFGAGVLNVLRAAGQVEEFGAVTRAGDDDRGGDRSDDR